MKIALRIAAFTCGLSAMSWPLSVAGQSLTSQGFDDIARVISPAITQADRLSAITTFDAIANRMLSVPDTPLKQIEKWHEITLAALAADHIPRIDSAGNKITLQQFGPHRSSYVTALVHLAMFEVTNAYSGKYDSWIKKHLPSTLSVDLSPSKQSAEDAAIEIAAYTMLEHLYPHFGGELQSALTYKNCDSRPSDVRSGCHFGQDIANFIILLRSQDNSQIPDPSFGTDFTPKNTARNPDGTYVDGQWSPDPVSKINVALGANWGKVTPFYDDTTLDGKDVQSILGGPPALNSTRYINAVKQVRDEGEDFRKRHPFVTPSKDAGYHYYVGKFWSYDGTPSLCAPVRLYNQIADAVLNKYRGQIAPKSTNGLDLEGAVDVIHYYAVLNLAMADAGIEAWKAKYKFQFWRPVVGVRTYLSEAELANSVKPTPEDPFPRQKFSELWFPLGAQNTNSAAGYNITPPFPAYPSGHAVFGSAMFEVLRHFVVNDTGFSVKSDELNPEARSVDQYNFTRCVDGDNNLYFCKDVSFTSFANAESCNSLSRIWLGVHWEFDALDGEKIGRAIGKAAWRQMRVKDASPITADPETVSGSCATPADFVADKY